MSFRATALLAASLSLAACGSEGATALGVTLVANHGFHSPLDAVASPDGATFYFSALTDDGVPAIFRVASAPGSTPAAIATGDPLVTPTGLVLSCDGATLYVAGGGADPLLAMPTGGGPLAPVAVTGARTLTGLAIGSDCETLYATGSTADGQPALLTMRRAGGAAATVYAGPPLIAPGGVFVDHADVAWVMNSSGGKVQSGSLYSIPSGGGSATPVVSGVSMNGVLGGVSLVSGGGTAVISGSRPTGGGELTTIDLASGARSTIAGPGMVGAGGLRTARNAPVLAVVDTEGDAIFRAESH